MPSPASVRAHIVDLVSAGLIQGSGVVTPQRDHDLKKFVLDTFGIRFPDKAVCPGHSSPWRVFSDAYFARAPIIVLKGSRLFAGKSFMQAVLAVTEAITLGVDVTVLGGSGAQSRRVLTYINKLWNYPNAPRDLLLDDPSGYKVKLKSGNVIEALLASPRSIRGVHPVRLHLDEVDEMPLSIFDDAMGLTFGHGIHTAQTFITSTHHLPDGTMTEILKRARERGWPTHEICYKESLESHGWLAQAEVDRKRLEMTTAQWEAEVELQEPSPEGRAINTQAVETMFRSLPDIPNREGRDNEYLEFEEPRPFGVYATGTDWAKDRDWTIIVTIRRDVKPMQVVAFERTGRLPWQVMIEKLNARVRRFGGSVSHDSTGVGKVTADMLVGREIEHFIMVGRDRVDLFSNYITGVERGDLISPMIQWAYQEHRFVRNDDLYGSGHPPDSVVAFALAYRSALQARAPGDYGVTP